MATQFEARQMQVRPLAKDLLVIDMDMGEMKTAGGIVIQSDDGKAHGVKPRWCRVWAIGPEQKDVKVGTWVCVEHGRWTRGIDIEDEDGKQTLRRVDPKDIMMESDDEPQDTTFSDAIHVEAKPDWMQHN
jgi:co-chaperonin GroES (HSP10)